MEWRAVDARLLGGRFSCQFARSFGEIGIELADVGCRKNPDALLTDDFGGDGAAQAGIVARPLVGRGGGRNEPTQNQDQAETRALYSIETDDHLFFCRRADGGHSCAVGSPLLSP